MASEHRAFIHLALSVSVLALITATSPAAAQESNETIDEVSQPGEILVTARKRTERLQDVPASIAVLTGAQLEQAQVSSIRDLNQIAPSLVVLSSGAGSNVSVLAIRGIGNNNATTTPRVGLIVDDVPLASQISVNGSGFFDVDQVEVLRGPQTSLYGLNAEGGLIVIRTKKPGNDVQGKISLGLTDDGEYRGSLSASGPVITDKLSVGFGVQYEQKDGFIFNPLINRNIDQTNRISARTRAILKPTETIEFDFSYAKHIVNSNFGVAFIPQDRALYNTTYGVNVPEFGIAADSPGSATSDADELAFRMSFDLGSVDLLSVTALRKYDQVSLIDPDQTPELFLPFFGGVATGEILFDQSAFTQELRLASRSAGPFIWTAGLFYFERNEAQKINLGLVNGQFIAFDADTDTKVKNSSIFAQATYKLSDAFSVTGGGRYERVRQNGVRIPILDGFAIPVERDTPILSAYSEEFFSFKGSVDLKPADDVLLYASVARAWLPGGVRNFIPDASQLPPDSDPSIFLAEKSWNYEIGAKMQLLDRRVTLNLAAYQTDISNYQELLADSNFTSFVSNADKVRAKGFEIELNARPVPQITVTGGLGYNDIKYTKFVDAEGIKTGNRVPVIPQYSASASVTWNPTEKLSVRGEWQSSGTFYEQNDDQNILGELTGYNIFNASFGYDDEHYSIQFFVNNISGKRYITYANDLNGDGILYGTPGQPRQFGVTAGYKF
jgi:iron complex outermembrane recepter protein